MINSKVIYNIAFFSIIFIYFQFLPINIETQPLFIILLIPLFLLIRIKKMFIIKSEEKSLYIYLGIVFVYFIISLSVGQADSLTYLLKFALGPISYLFLLKNVDFLEVKTLKIMTLILFAISIINLFRIPILYDMLNVIMNTLFNRYSFDYSGVRGMCILTPEPSYFVYFAMLLLFSFDFIEYKNNKKEYLFFKILIFFMCIITKSAIVYGFLCLYLLLKYVFGSEKFNFKHFFKGVLVFSSIIVVVLLCVKLFNINLLNNRLFQVFNSITSNSFFDILFFSDESAGFRFLINAIYILSVFIKPFGYGFGGMEKSWSSVARAFNIEYHKNGMFKYAYNEFSNLHAQAFFPNVIGAIGIFSIFPMFFVYKNNTLNRKPLKNSILIVLTLFLWFLQSNMFNPVFWVLIAFCKYNNQEKKEKII